MRVEIISLKTILNLKIQCTSQFYVIKVILVYVIRKHNCFGDRNSRVEAKVDRNDKQSILKNWEPFTDIQSVITHKQITRNILTF